MTTETQRPTTDHEKLNRVIFSETEAARIESERPANGIPIPTDNGFELAAYRMPNGSKFVTLMNGSEATWEAYCKHIAKSS